MLMGRGFTLPQSTIEICGFPGLKIETWGTQHQARMGNPTPKSGAGDKNKNYLEDGFPAESDFPKLQGCRAGLGHSMVLFAGTAAHADGSNNLAVDFERNSAGEDHDSSVIRSMDSKELTA